MKDVKRMLVGVENQPGIGIQGNLDLRSHLAQQRRDHRGALHHFHAL
jgi:hypothetical protein